MKRIILFLATILAAALSFAQQPQALPNDPAVRTGKLDNGMTYYIRHNDKPAQRAEFYLATNVGAIQEAPDQDGLAHFLEHMCFNGTKNLPGKTMLEYLQSIGASFGGNINASTGVEQTIYMLNNIPVVRESIVDTCLLIMHDYSHFVTNDPEEIDKERGVIIEEKRTRNTAQWRMFEKAMPYLYGDSKYATCTVIGSQENLETFKPESLWNFYQTWCRPDLQAVIVVGDIDVDQVESKIKTLFADIPAPENPQPKVMPVIPDNEEPVIGILTDPELTQTSVEVYWKIPTTPKEFNNTDAVYINDFVKAVIRLVMRERFSDIASRPDAPFLGANFGIGGFVDTADAIQAAVSSKDSEAIPAFKALMTELEKMVRYGFTEGEVSRAKDVILSQAEKEAEAADTRQNAEYIYPLIGNFFDNDPYMDPATELELIQALSPMITAEIINMSLQNVFPDNNMIVLYYGPEKEGVSHPTEADILAAIEEVEASEIQANEAEAEMEPLLDPATLKGSAVKKESAGINGSTEWTLKNGVKVVVLPTEYKKDQVMIEARKQGGMTLIATEDLPSFENNISAMFESSTGISKFPKTVLDKMLAGSTARVGMNIGTVTHGISASCSPKDLETAFQLLYLKYTDPRFDQDEWDAAMAKLASIVPNYVTTPDYLFSKEVFSTLYGNSPRYQIISEEVMEQASLQTYERVYRELFKDAAGTVVYIVGNVDFATLKPLVEKYIGSLPKGKKATEINAGNAYKVVSGQVENEFAAAMHSPKCSVILTWNADVPYSVKSEVAYDALEYILNMVYTDTLREDEGGTYGAGVGCNTGRTPFENVRLMTQFDTNEESCDKLVALAIDGLKKLAEEGPTDEFYGRTIENMKKMIPENRISNRYWLSSLIKYNDYGEDYVSLYEAAVNELTPADVKAAAETLIESGNLIKVVMSPQPEAAAE